MLNQGLRSVACPPPPPNFCQDGSWNFTKIDEEIVGGGGSSKIFREVEGVAKKVSFMPPPNFMALAIPLGVTDRNNHRKRSLRITREDEKIIADHFFQGANFTISADSRTYASGIAAGPNKKGQQQTIIVLPDIYQRHTSGGSKDTIEEESTKESGAKSIAQQNLPSPETKTSSAEKTYPVTMDTPPPATGGGGAGGEFIFPDLSTLSELSLFMPITYQYNLLFINLLSIYR